MFIGQPQFVFNEMQINEYDITNELGEREYRFDGQQPLNFNNNTIFESLLKDSKSLKSLGFAPWIPYYGFALDPLGALSGNQTPPPPPISCLLFILTPATPLVVDQEVKNALDDPVSNCSMPYTDFKPLIMKYILKRWQGSWDQQIYNKLYEIHSLVVKTPCDYGQNRKEQVVLTRCRIGHSRLTHSYLLNNEERPECIPCNSNFSLKHVLIDCVDVVDVRQTFYNANSLSNLFTNVAGDTILQFLKEINLYTKI